MSYSKQIKSEIVSKRLVDKDNSLSTLSAIIKTCGEIKLGKQKQIIIINDQYDVYEYINKLLLFLYDTTANLEMLDEVSFKNFEKYEIIIPSELCEKILIDCFIMSKKNDNFDLIDGIDPVLVRDYNTISGYIRGAFLGCGTTNISLNSQDKTNISSGYHLEFVFSNYNLANDFCLLLSDIGVISKKIVRKGQYVVYIKSFDLICDLLTVVGATNCVLELQNESALRSIKNNVNRQNNCMSANIGKTVNASIKQLDAINLIIQTIGIESLQADLQEVACLRLANNEESLDTLVKLLDGKYSKSALNRKFIKLISIAKDLQ